MMARVIHEEGPEMGRINLLLSILIHYPQISTVKYLEQGTVCFNFMFKTEEPLAQEELATRIKQSLLAHCQLLGDEAECCQVGFKDLNMYGSLEVTRDLGSLSGAEITLLISLVRDGLGPRLMIENQELMAEEIVYQDEVISSLLEDLREFPKGNTLSGLRENGHVLVFNHQDVDLRR